MAPSQCCRVLWENRAMLASRMVKSGVGLAFCLTNGRANISGTLLGDVNIKELLALYFSMFYLHQTVSLCLHHHFIYHTIPSNNFPLGSLQLTTCIIYFYLFITSCIAIQIQNIFHRDVVD